MAPSLSYFAGFFDGEGSVLIRFDRRCNSYILKVTVTNCALAPLEAMQSRWGGCLVHVKGRKSHHSGWTEWQLQGGKAEPFLRAIRPYVLIKGQQIDLGLKLLSTRHWVGKGHRLTPETLAIRAALKEELHSIKTKGHGLRGAC